MKNKYFFILLIACTILNIHVSAQTVLSSVIPCNSTLTLSGSPYLANSDVTVPSGCTLSVAAGAEIRMAENTHFIIKGTANFMGTASQPIYIHAQDTIWGNIYLDSTLSQKSTFDNVIIANARLSVNPGQEPGAIYPYYSSVEIKNCHFQNNLRCVSAYKCQMFQIKNCILDASNNGEKIHGQYCDGAVIDNNILYMTYGDNDAIDFDASNNITITNNQIYGGGDDGMDIGQTDSIGCNIVTIQHNFIFNMFNKGISNGEYCNNINIDHNVIVGCAMGIGAKSGAVVVADHNTLYNNRMGVDSYEHLNQIWGPGHLTVTNCIIAGSDTTFHVDPTAYLSIAYSLSPDTLMPGTGNLKGNPAFILPGQTASSDFHLLALSAAINMGDPAFAQDPDGTRSDIGAFYFDLSNNIDIIPQDAAMSLYPNPSSGSFCIKFSAIHLQPKNTWQLKILNVGGQVIYTDNIPGDHLANEYNLDLQKQARGIYYLQIVSDKSTSVRKLVLN